MPIRQIPIIEKIKEAKTMKQLDDLREEIHLAASFNEIDFKQVKEIFLKKKRQLRDRAWGYQA